jgi:tetratricopeptide (TPR) repeat protein
MEHEDFNMDGAQSDDFLSELLSRFEQMMSGQHPGFFDADEFLELIDYYIMTSQLHLAGRALDMAINQYPGNTDIHVYRCRYLHASGRTSRAIQLLNRILEQQPENVEALISLGEILSDIGKQTEAVNYFEIALGLVESDEKQIVIQQIVDALDEVGQHHRMIPYLKDMIRLFPGNSEAMSGLAYCYNILSREEEGIVFFTKLVDKDPFNTYAWFNLGTLYYGISQLEKAVEAFEYVLAIEPKFTSAAIKMGSALSALERTDSAIKVYKEVLEYEQKDASIYCYLAYCYSHKKEYKTAIYYFQKAVSFDAEMTEAYLGLVYACAGIDKFESSYKYMKRVLEDYDDVADLWFFKAYLEEQTEQFEEAVLSFRKGLDLNPHDVNAWLSLAGMLTEYFDQYDEALSVIDDALVHNPENIEILYRAAAMCFEAGLNNEGSLWLHKALFVDSTRTELLFMYNPLLQNNSTINDILNQYL